MERKERKRMLKRIQEKSIERREKRLEEIKRQSPSEFFIKERISILGDWIMWIIIGIFVIVWWTQRAEDIPCHRITEEVLRSCKIIGENTLGVIGK